MKFLALILLSILATNLLAGDTLDHQLFLKEINNSNSLVYQVCLEKYNAYLVNNPSDVSVHIEKCKFIEFAQYDDEEEYNPNQEAFDSCTADLVKLFPSNPEVLLFQITYLWGDELKSVFDTAQLAIEDNPEEWNDVQLGVLYKRMSLYYYAEADIPKALVFIQKAIAADSTYGASLDYARILIETDKKPEALLVLQAGKDTTNITWELSRKADLYLELDDYEDALKLYNRINEIDSTFNDNAKIASTLEGIGEFNEARIYLLADTSTSWNKKNATKNLFLHDLKFENDSLSLASYNQYRNYGFSSDPLGIFRIKLFFSHPLLAWKLRDIAGLISFRLSIILLLLLPFLWLLPIYFIGQYFNLTSRPKDYTLRWGLKAFWFVSAGYLLASFLPFLTDPEYLYSLLLSSFKNIEFRLESQGRIGILFICFSALIGFATLYKTTPKVLLSIHWTITQSILTSIGIFIVYKIIVGIYFTIVISQFGITTDELVGFLSYFLATKQEITAIMAVGGKWLGFILICFLVPVYEEIIFRGVILDACQRYLNFRSANLIQAMMFATVHMNLYLFPVFLLFGIIGGLMRKQSGGLLSGIVFHVINNILAISIFLMK